MLAYFGPPSLPALAIFLWSFACTIGVGIAAFQHTGAARRIYGSLSFVGVLMLSGVATREIHGAALGIDQPFPSYADLLHVPAYSLFAGVIFSIHRIRATRRDFDAWLDAGAITAAAFLLLWVGFLAAFLVSDVGIAEVVLSTFYNAAVFVAAAFLIRIGASPGERPTSYLLLGFAGVAFVVTDIAGAVSSANGQTLFVAIALGAVVYGLVFAAAWHPSAPEIANRPAIEEERISNSRFVISGVAIAVPSVAALLPNQTQLGQIGSIVLSLVIATLFAWRILRLLVAQRNITAAESQLAGALGRLASLKTTSEIVAELPLATTEIFGADAELVLGAPTDNSDIELGATLSQEMGSSAIRLESRATYDPTRSRIFSSFIRDANAIAASKEAVLLQANEQSKAEANKRIESNERRFRALVQNASDVIVVLNQRGIVTYMSDSTVRVLGYETSAFVGRSLDWVVHENDWDFALGYMESFLTGTSSHLEHEIRAMHLDGSTRLLSMVLTDMRHIEGIDGIVVNVTDVTEKRRLEVNLRDAETIDPLTLQLNRTAFIREIDAALRRTSITVSSVALAVVNLDDFRLINEGYGNATADLVLVEVARRIRQSVRLDDAVARLNGDEFGILMPNGYSALEAEAVIQRILDELTTPIQITGKTIALRATAGLVHDADGSSTGIAMLRDVDTALDTAKSTCRGGVLQFEESMGQDVSERVELRNMLHDALANDRLRLAFQPIVDIESGAIVGLEALARWHDKLRGNISPGTFVPIAESAGMISELGEWALRTACHHVVDWAEQGYDDFTVSVNMSGHQLREENVIAKVDAVLKETGVDPTRITIEITESVLIDDTDFVANRICALRDLGLKLAIDDFGTGFSSLSYLRQYEFDVLKIDRSFVIPLADDANKREREIVNAMIKLAQALGAITIGEGIEQPEEYAVLRTLGCDRGQGYLLWYPMEAEDVVSALSSESNKIAS